jgi:hypothetical protein
MITGTDNFTLYLRGPDKMALIEAIKPFGNGGDMDRFTLESCGAEVVLGAEVALIRVPYDSHELAVRDLIDGLHREAQKRKLSFSDDVNSSKEPALLFQAYQRERARAGFRSEGPKAIEWSLGQKVMWAALALVGLGLILFLWNMLHDAGNNVSQRFG